MSGPTVFQGAWNVVVSGTVTAANTVRESLMVHSYAFEADCRGSSADKLQPWQQSDVQRSDPSQTEFKHSIHRPH